MGSCVIENSGAVRSLRRMGGFAESFRAGFGPRRFRGGMIGNTICDGRPAPQWMVLTHDFGVGQTLSRSPLATLTRMRWPFRNRYAHTSNSTSTRYGWPGFRWLTVR